jgi:hypothetical protein
LLWLPFCAYRPIRANHNSKIAGDGRAFVDATGVVRAPTQNLRLLGLDLRQIDS